MIKNLSIPDVWLYSPPRIADQRGWFSETYNTRTLATVLGGAEFVQDNQSQSVSAGTLRGMHLQIPPKAQDKLVRVVKGSILDVAVDLRKNSPTYAQWVSAELSAANGAQLFVPKGFAHGFITLEPDTEVIYKVSDYYSRDHERGIAWDDTHLAIDWQWPKDAVTIAERDRNFPRLCDLQSFF